MLNKEFLDTLTPVEIQMVHQYINILFKNKITSSTANYENLETSVDECPYCHCKHIVRNGHNNKTGRQRYLCKNKECGQTFEATTNTFFSHSKAKYQTWLTFIGCEVVGLSLRQESVITGVSVTGCFNMRHKLYNALRDYQQSQKLKGTCEVDATYVPINLKGWNPDDMPRFSKRRGKHKPDSQHPNLRGISHHKICIVSAVDEYDHILFRIAGLGQETFEMYNKFKDHFSEKCMIVADSKPCIAEFASANHLEADIIPSGEFKSPKLNTLAALNQLHQEFSELIRRKHGVGTRHLQGYIDWLVMTKRLRYRTDAKKMNTEIYMNIMKNSVNWTTDDICHIPMPIDLDEAYYEFMTDVNQLHQHIS